MGLRGGSIALFVLALVGVWGGLFSDPPTGVETSRIVVVARATLSFETFLGLLAVAVAMLTTGGVTRRLGLGRGRLSRTQTIVLIVGTLAMSAALDALLDLSNLREHSSLAEFEGLVAGIRGRELAVAFLAFAVAPGICEELLCRGLVQRGLAKRFGAPMGILLASAIFGALHLDPVHAVFAGALGLYLGTVCHLANGIRPVIACHVVNNSVALGSAALFPTPWPEMSWAVFFLGSGVALGTLRLVWVQLKSAPAIAAPVPGPTAPST